MPLPLLSTVETGSADVAWPSRLAPEVLDTWSTPTPFLACDLGTVRRRHRQLRAALPTTECCYAMKCNPSIPILRTLVDEGAGFEVASLGEVQVLQQLGVDLSEVLYSNPVKPPAHVREAARLGVRQFAFDGPGELQKIAVEAPGAGVYLRIRVEDGRSRFPLSRKFGADPAHAEDLLRAARRHGLVPLGLAFHVGSQCEDPKAWSTAIATCGRIITALDSVGIHLEVLNLGGGFPARYGDAAAVPAIEAIGAEIVTALASLPRLPARTIVEPGRFLVGESAVLATSVIGREQRGDEHWLYLDVGSYHGMMEALQTSGTWAFPIRMAARPWPGEADERLVAFTLTGPTCDSSDTMFERVPLPASVGVGDRLFIGTAGAYTISYASSFNGFPPPVTAFVGAR